MKVNLKSLFDSELSSPARDKNGDIIRKEVNGQFVIVTRADVVVDKVISRAERGDIHASKLMFDFIQPKELRIAVASAITVEHTLSPQLQAIVDKLALPETDKKTALPEKLK